MLESMSLAELRRLIDDESLPVAKHVGGATRRTKADIITEIARTHRQPSTPAATARAASVDTQDNLAGVPVPPGQQMAGMRVLRHVLGPAAKEVNFADIFFGSRCITLESPAPTLKFAEVPAPVALHEGAQYELLACKKHEVGTEFHGGKKFAWRWLYAARKDDLPLSEELQQVADFAALPNARKAAARLELLLSPAKTARDVHQLTSDAFELIDSPLGAVSGEEMDEGCGFIPDAICSQLAGPEAVAVQVRVFAPRLGVFKGMLQRAYGIERIVLTSSMRKVGPSPVATDSWATLIVKLAHPTKANAALGRRLTALDAPPPPPSKPLSTHVSSLLAACGAPSDALAAYAEAEQAEHAMVVGVADPTCRLPAGSVFVTGLPFARTGGTANVFVTRCPCVLPSDGRLPALVTAQPAGMPNAEWDWLCSLPFGALLFSTAGDCSLPAQCASGDLDGDYYLVCWSPSLLPHLHQRRIPPAPGAPPPAASAAVLGEGWLAAAQAHMTSPQVMREDKDVGPCFKAWERLASHPDYGWDHEDTRRLAECYLALLDLGKHGGTHPVDALPAHLRKLRSVGRPVGNGHRPATRAQTAAESESAAAAAAAEVADATADCAPLQGLSLEALRALIAREGLAVKGNVGGKSRRTKQTIIDEIQSARGELYNQTGAV